VASRSPATRCRGRFGGFLWSSLSLSPRIEFLDFDGNPQSLRLVSKLQTSVAHVGLDLTAATLAASLKYPVGAKNREPNNPVAKKFGYFESEQSLIRWIREKTGPDEGQRHPLTWIMEACDNIAYSVLDVDDAMKKGVISPDDIVSLWR
jgi:dGTPase